MSKSSRHAFNHTQFSRCSQVKLKAKTQEQLFRTRNLTGDAWLARSTCLSQLRCYVCRCKCWVIKAFCKLLCHTQRMQYSNLKCVIQFNIPTITACPTTGGEVKHTGFLLCAQERSCPHLPVDFRVSHFFIHWKSCETKSCVTWVRVSVASPPLKLNI